MSSGSKVSQPVVWRGVILAVIVSLLHSTVSNCFLASLYAYTSVLHFPDHYASLLGISTLFMFAGSLFFGFYADKVKKEKPSFLAGLLFCIIGSAIYFAVEKLPGDLQLFMLYFSRAVYGFGTGFISILYTYSTRMSGSYVSKVSAFNTFTGAIGQFLNLLMNALFGLIGYPGTLPFFGVPVHRYNVIGLYAVLIYAVCFAGVYFFLIERESKECGDDEEEESVPSNHVCLALICMLRAAQAYVATNMDATAAQYISVLYGLSADEVTLYNTRFHAVMGVVSAAVSIFNMFSTRLSKLSWRASKLISMGSLVSFLVYYIASFPTSILYSGSAVENVRGYCVSKDYEWCQSVKPVSPVVFYGLYLVFVNIAYVLMSSAMSVLTHGASVTEKSGRTQALVNGMGPIAQFASYEIQGSVFKSFGPQGTSSIVMTVLVVVFTIAAIGYRNIVEVRPRPVSIEIETTKESLSSFCGSGSHPAISIGKAHTDFVDDVNNRRSTVSLP